MSLNYLWGGMPYVKKESEDYEVALKEDLDFHGEFELNEDGLMEFVDFLSLRAAIIRQVHRSTLEKRTEFRLTL